MQKKFHGLAAWQVQRVYKEVLQGYTHGLPQGECPKIP